MKHHKKKKMKPLAGHEHRTAQSFLRTVQFHYDSRWLVTKEGEHKRACVPTFTGLFSASRMTPKERQNYIDMFAREVVKNFQAPWIIEVQVYFDDGVTVYVEEGQMVTATCKINDAVPAFEQLRSELVASGNANHYRYFTWTAKVFKGHGLIKDSAQEELARVKECSDQRYLLPA